MVIFFLSSRASELFFLDKLLGLYWFFGSLEYNTVLCGATPWGGALIYGRNSAMNKLTDIDEGVIRRVDWQSLVPPTLFFRAFSATFKFSFIALGALLIALFATTLGVRSCFIEPQLAGCDSSCDRSLLVVGEPFCAGEGVVVSALAPIKYSFRVSALQDMHAQFCAERLESCVCFLPTLIVGLALAGLFALALSRATLVRLLTTSRSSLFASFTFAIRRLPSALLPCAIPCLLLAALIALGMVGRIGVLHFAAPVVVALSFITLFLCVVTSFSAPLAVSAIAAENCDGFDATSRGISYLTQRPLFWIFYMVAAAILTVIGFVIFEAFAQLALVFFDNVYYGATSRWIDFWRLTVIATPDSYLAVALVVYTNAVYALLRRSVDGTPYDSCALNLGKGESKKLRRILQDGKGAPTFDSENARREEEKSRGI